MVETRRLSELRSRLNGLLRLPGGDLVVALSGGADSAALAYLLAGLGRRARAVHVDHGQPASARLEEAARAVAEAVGIELDVSAIVVAPGASFEGQARQARYQALFASLRPGETLLTAHTLDDQAETVLMNLLRGSGPAGLAGITARTDALARPMLAIGRSETRELATLASLPFFDDPSNLDHEFRRNSIRLQVIPDLSARFNPRLIEALARFAELAGADDAFLRDEAEKVPVLGEGSRRAVPVGSLLAVARPVADRALRGMLARVRPPHRGSAAELEEMWSVVTRRRKSAMLAGGIEVALEGPLLVVRSPEPATASPGSTPLEIGDNDVGPFQVVVERTERVCRVAPLGLWAALFPVDVSLDARVDEEGRLVVTADRETAWVAGQRRLPVAWYEPGTSGYLSVFAREGSGWTSSP